MTLWHVLLWMTVLGITFVLLLGLLLTVSFSAYWLAREAHMQRTGAMIHEAAKDAFKAAKAARAVKDNNGSV